MRKLTAILLGGLVAGVLDIIYAFVVYGPLSYQLSPIQVLHLIAAGWIGSDAANAGGWHSAALGLGTHFMLTMIFATVFAVVSMRLPLLTRNAVLSGLLYGFGLYLVMTYIIVPLSAANQSQHFATDLNDAVARLRESFSSVRPRDPWQLLGTIFTHTVFVGVPISLMNRRFS